MIPPSTSLGEDARPRDSDSELCSSLAGEALALYVNNPFRVLNIPTDSTTVQAQKRAQKLKVWRQMGERVPDEYSIREALQTLRDPQKRLIAELFWFHVDAFAAPGSSSAQALEKFKAGNWQEARDLWYRISREERNEESGRRALHNLAVLLHARVVTHEAGKNPLIKRLGSNRDLPAEHLTSWRQALVAWREYLACDAAWKHWRARAFDIGDKRLSTHFVAQLRTLLPEVLLQINRDLARRYVASNYGLAAGAHCRLMLGSQLGDETARAFCRTVVDPLKKRVLEACEESREQFVSSDAAYDIAPAAWKFAGRMRVASALLLQIDPQKEFGAVAAREGVAQTLRSAALHLAHHKQFSESLKILSIAIPLADSPTLKSDLADIHKDIRLQVEVWRRATPRCLLCKQHPEDWTVFTNDATSQKRLVFLCKMHAGNREEQRELAQVNIQWNRLPQPPSGLRI